MRENDLRDLGLNISFEDIKDKETITISQRQLINIFKNIHHESVNRLFFIFGYGHDIVTKHSPNEVIINRPISEEMYNTFLKRRKEKVEKEVILPSKIMNTIPQEKFRWKYLVLIDYIFNRGFDPFTKKVKPVHISSFGFEKLLSGYYKYKDFLIESGIISVNHAYCTITHKSKSYILNKDFLNNDLVSEKIYINLVRTFEETDKKEVKELKVNRDYFNYLRSDKWLNFREGILEERGRRCEKCLTPNFLTLHHITYKNIFNEKPEDVLVLCEGCHDKEHGITPRIR